jgi:hypothetical protein
MVAKAPPFRISPGARAMARMDLSSIDFLLDRPTRQKRPEFRHLFADG